ncbi:MAG: ADP-heptose--LPS heptosyltransferase [Rhodospirillaceae bacterium]|nr:ADP-heptose--LPS heptosyltransferase [Rhodospirillaceae bacterium]|tara:strand:+ start:1026 stop:1967 length:942 start_codon:yes stop_codon:yes gene_type:complete
MTEDAREPERILVIKLGALGDVVQATGPFAAIRAHHPTAHITLLTAPAIRDFLDASSWFDEMWVDSRPSWRDLRGWLALRRRLRRGRFDRAYDLQTSDRSSLYYHLMAPGRRPEWSGIARGAKLRHRNPNRDNMHTIDRQSDQLAVAGIAEVPPPSLDWVAAETARYGILEPYVLLVPGGSAHRPEKRWPVGSFTELARRLAVRGMTPVLIGAGADVHATGTVASFCPEALDLTSDTSFAEIVALARGAASAVGNDTGPMHVIATAGCPSVALYSFASDPALCAQKGPDVTILQRDMLSDLSVDEVEAALKLD